MDFCFPNEKGSKRSHNKIALCLWGTQIKNIFECFK